MTQTASGSSFSGVPITDTEAQCRLTKSLKYSTCYFIYLCSLENKKPLDSKLDEGKDKSHQPIFQREMSLSLYYWVDPGAQTDQNQ